MSLDEFGQGVLIIGAIYFLGWLPVLAWGFIKERREWNAAHTAEGKTHRASQADEAGFRRDEDDAAWEGEAREAIRREQDDRP